MSVTLVDIDVTFPTTQEDVSSLIRRLQERDPSLSSVVMILNNASKSRDLQVGWPLLSDALRENSCIATIHLDLSHAAVESRGWQPLLSVLPTLVALKHISLRHCNIASPSLCSKVLDSLDRARPDLETLDLSHNPLGPRGAKVLASFLQTTPRLRVLKVGHASLGHFGAQALGGSLPDGLVVLDLSHNNMGHDGIWKLADAGLTQRLNRLRELDVSHNQIGDDGCLEIAHRLGWLTALERLDLSHNDIGTVGVEGLAQSLMDLAVPLLPPAASQDSDGAPPPGTTPQLRRLAMAGNRLDNDAARHLGIALTKLTCLTHLDLSRNVIGDEGSQSIVDGLMVLATDQALQVLDLSHNRIGDLGAGAFVEHLESLEGLQKLILHDNTVSEARTRILDMLLKHRHTSTTATPSSSARATSLLRKGDPTSFSSASLRTLDDVDEGSAGSGDLQPPDWDAEKIATGRDLMAELLDDFDDDDGEFDSGSVATPNKSVLPHSRPQLPVEYLRYLTDNFSKSHLLGYGAFGPLYALRHDSEREGEQGDEGLSEAKLILRRLELGSAGPLQAVRESVVNELWIGRHRLGLAGWLAPVAVTVTPSAHYVLYDVADRISLRDALRELPHRRALALRTRVAILTRVASALRHLHTAPPSTPGGPSFNRTRATPASFHGDIQPSNVYLSLSDYTDVRMSDAHLSRLVATDRRRFESGDTVFGVRSYRCPRYERGSVPYEAASDIFGFGILMAEVLSGRLQRSAADAKAKGGGGSRSRYDVYYDVLLAQVPFEFDPERREDPGAVQPSAEAMQTLLQVMYACLNSAVAQRPTAATVAHILDHQIY